MSERAAQIARVDKIDRIFRELTWHGQKHAIQTLTRPEIGLTMPQMMTLLAIHDSGSCRMGRLADVTQQSGGTLTGIFDRLIDDGLVERVRSAGDRRVIEVTLTSEGRARVEEVLAARRGDMEHILSGFSDYELEHFESLLVQFLHGLRGTVDSDSPAREIGA